MICFSFAVAFVNEEEESALVFTERLKRRTDISIEYKQTII